MPRRHPALIRLLAPAAALLLTGCALSGGTTPAPVPPGAAAPSVETTPLPVLPPSPEVTASETPSVAAPTGSAAPTLGAPSASPGATVITVPVGSQRQLSETDAASAGTWIRGGFQPAGAAASVESLAQPVVCGDMPTPLVFRFANTAGSLTLGVAQAATSASSAQTLTWTITTDGRLQQTRRLTFLEAADLSVPLAGVSTVEISVSNQDACSGSAIALITKAVVSG